MSQKRAATSSAALGVIPGAASSSKKVTRPDWVLVKAREGAEMLSFRKKRGETERHRLRRWYAGYLSLIQCGETMVGRTTSSAYLVRQLAAVVGRLDQQIREEASK